MELMDQLDQAVAFVRARCPQPPQVGLVLGSGLGDFAGRLSDSCAIDYADIPHFRRVTVAGHAGRLVMGTVGGRSLAVLQGRFHYYEGHDIGAVVFPVRLLCRLGVDAVLLTNAAGGIGAHLQPGTLMAIRDHINLMGVNPLRGANDERLGPRFPDMSAVYDPAIRQQILHEQNRLGLKPAEGVYLALSGPSYETPAEIRMLARLGADAVGMSTVPEAIVARHMGVRVGGISCITNLAAGISPEPLSHAEVTATANRVRADFIALLERLVPAI